MSGVMAALLDGRPEPRPLVINRDETPRMDAPIPRWKYEEVEEERDRLRSDLETMTAAYSDLQRRNGDLVTRCRDSEDAERMLRRELGQSPTGGQAEELGELESLRRTVATQRLVIQRKDEHIRKLGVQFEALRQRYARPFTSPTDTGNPDMSGSLRRFFGL